jgi:hypothetical protein
MSDQQQEVSNIDDLWPPQDWTKIYFHECPESRTGPKATSSWVRTGNWLKKLFGRLRASILQPRLALRSLCVSTPGSLWKENICSTACDAVLWRELDFVMLITISNREYSPTGHLNMPVETWCVDVWDVGFVLEDLLRALVRCHMKSNMPYLLIDNEAKSIEFSSRLHTVRITGTLDICCHITTTEW